MLEVAVPYPEFFFWYSGYMYWDQDFNKSIQQTDRQTDESYGSI